mmetsp:Transcript_4041/g.11708  ORF Transcript_4041/g.11708 Transcript_4041/m.11708 type:complete len:207 (+) Transcript_4041:598-1218(+)
MHVDAEAVGETVLPTSCVSVAVVVPEAPLAGGLVLLPLPLVDRTVRPRHDAEAAALVAQPLAIVDRVAAEDSPPPAPRQLAGRNGQASQLLLLATEVARPVRFRRRGTLGVQPPAAHDGVGSNGDAGGGGSAVLSRGFGLADQGVEAAVAGSARCYREAIGVRLRRSEVERVATAARAKAASFTSASAHVRGDGAWGDPHGKRFGG